MIYIFIKKPFKFIFQTTFDIWREKYKNEAIQEPKTLATSYTINYPNGTATAQEYSTFQQNVN